MVLFMSFSPPLSVVCICFRVICGLMDVTSQLFYTSVLQTTEDCF